MADIVDVAINAGNFATLVKAIQATGLVETLKGPGPFTVFAPTDAAFTALPPESVEGLLKDIPKLKNILLYHVVSGKIIAKDIKTSSVKTVLGQDVELKVSGSFIKKINVNDATVVKADVMADNGVIHTIDKMILPK